jgi:hypothetical protein
MIANFSEMFLHGTFEVFFTDPLKVNFYFNIQKLEIWKKGNSGKKILLLMTKTGFGSDPQRGTLLDPDPDPHYDQ